MIPGVTIVVAIALAGGVVWARFDYRDAAVEALIKNRPVLTQGSWDCKVADILTTSDGKDEYVCIEGKWSPTIYGLPRKRKR